MSSNADTETVYAKRTGEITIVRVSWGRELEIMATVAEALERLDQPARDRVLRWARDKYLSWRPLADDGDA
jgi:hypothetical protein